MRTERIWATFLLIIHIVVNTQAGIVREKLRENELKAISDKGAKMRVFKNLGASIFMAIVIVLMWAGLDWLVGYSSAYYELFMGAITGAFAVFLLWDLDNEREGK